MNIERLIEAAKEIDRKAALQEERSARGRELARMARHVEPDGPEHRRIKAEARELGRTVVDFGDPINALRAALRAKPSKKPAEGEAVARRLKRSVGVASPDAG